jgi:hypothetical protein
MYGVAVQDKSCSQFVLLFAHPQLLNRKVLGQEALDQLPDHELELVKADEPVALGVCLLDHISALFLGQTDAQAIEDAVKLVR